MGFLPKIQLKESWRLFTGKEKRDIFFYIIGIMCYKFGLEAFNGSFIALATNRYDYDAEKNNTTAKTFERLGLLTGLYQAFQCVGAIIIAPLIKRFATKNVLAAAIIVFAFFTAILLIVDGASGGRLMPKGWHKIHGKDDFSYYGKYNTDGMIPIYCVSGIAYGMVELIRRVIPRDIVGGNVIKLRQMDATVHIFYEIAGTAGAFCTALGLIPALGNNYSFIITPICFTCAAVAWLFVSKVGDAERLARMSDEDRAALSLEDVEHKNIGYFKQIATSLTMFHKSIWTGGKIIFTSRQYIWLLPGYSLALYGHRYLENGISPAIAKRYFGVSAWSQIMVGGSNFGELLGALFVFLFNNLIHTPLPWLRLDGLVLLIVWYIPFWHPAESNVRYAWIAAATFIPVSFGWAAGDVSLAAYIQASLARAENKTPEVSALGAVMAFLYSTYIVVYAVISYFLGRYLDKVSAANDGEIQKGMINVAGVQFTILGAIMLAATMVPKGALSFNPSLISGERLNSDLEETKEDADSDTEKRKQSKSEVTFIAT